MMINNKKLITIKMFILAGEASIMPPIGPMLTQYGVNAIKFCNEFNEKTYMFCNFFENVFYINKNNFEEEKFLFIVEIDVFLDKSYTMKIKKPTISFLLKLFTRTVPSKFVKSSRNVMDLKLLLLIARYKYPSIPLYSASTMIVGTARAMNIEIYDNMIL